MNQLVPIYFTGCYSVKHKMTFVNHMVYIYSCKKNYDCRVRIPNG